MKYRVLSLIGLMVFIMSITIGVSAQEATPVREPYVTAKLNVNVRAGDGTSYRRITVLSTNQTASIIGINSRRSWYQIQLTNGRIGWVGSSVVTVTGDLTNVPVVATTAQPTTPTTTPTTSTNNQLSDLSASPPKVEPASPSCGVAFNVLVNINNAGPAKSNTPATIYIEDIVNGVTVTAFTTVLPQIDPSVNYVVGGLTTVNTGGGQVHTIRVTIDPENRVTEGNENNNTVTSTYTLTGAC